MRIAFVGKGGSGKTTLAALFAEYLKENTKRNILAIDADINMHMAELLGFDKESIADKELSNPKNADLVRAYLKGNNSRIKEIKQFWKTTPPTRESNFIRLSENSNTILESFSSKRDNLYFMIVGTYESDKIGTSCYHGSLSVLENILSHTIDDGNYIVADMVAGTDAFANTLHAQLDILALVIEPTIKGLEVFKQYHELAKSAGILDNIIVVGNKIRGKTDKQFLEENIPAPMLFGFFYESKYLRKYDQEGGRLDAKMLENKNTKLFKAILEKLSKTTPDYNKRLRRLYEIHRRLANQNKEIMDQIDETFEYDYILQKQR
jgi:CO dehydrogenase maturation factor